MIGEAIVVRGNRRYHSDLGSCFSFTQQRLWEGGEILNGCPVGKEMENRVLR